LSAYKLLDATMLYSRCEPVTSTDHWSRRLHRKRRPHHHVEARDFPGGTDAARYSLTETTYAKQPIATTFPTPNEELSCRPEPCQPICFSQAQPLASDCTLPVSSNDKLCTSDLRHLIQISPRPARRVFSRAPFTPQAGWGRSSLRTNAALGAALPGPGPPRRQPTHGSRSSKPATLAAPAPPAPRPQRPQVAIIRKEVLTSTEEYLCQNLGLCFSPRMSDLVVHNIEVSCAAESPTRSLPTDSQRLHSGSIVHFRRQLHRFVRWLAFPHQPTES
jgi:hypothetical protein